MGGDGCCDSSKGCCPPQKMEKGMDYESNVCTPEIEEKGVKHYYSQTLETKDDLKTNACCIMTAFPPYIKECIKHFPPVVMDKSCARSLMLSSGNKGLVRKAGRKVDGKGFCDIFG